MDGNGISGIRQQILANAAVAFLGGVPPRTGVKEKGKREMGFDILVRRCGQDVQAYLTCGEGSACAVLVVAKSAPTIQQAMMDLMLDVGDLATKLVVPTKESGLWAAKPGQMPILKKAFEEGGQYRNPYHCGS